MPVFFAEKPIVANARKFKAYRAMAVRDRRRSQSHRNHLGWRNSPGRGANPRMKQYVATCATGKRNRISL